jgi:hypothetical protein
MPGESNKQLEPDAPVNTSFDDAWNRWAETNPSFCYAFHQQSFDFFCALNARHVAKTLLDKMQHLRDDPYHRVSAIIAALSPGAEIQGTLLFAVLTRKPYMAPEVGHEVGLETLLKSHTSLQEDDSEESKAYQTSIGQLILLEDLLPSAARAFATHVAQQFQELESYEVQLNEIVTDLMLDGIQTEFLFTRLVNEGDATKYLLKKMLSDLTDGGNHDDEDT